MKTIKASLIIAFVLVMTTAAQAQNAKLDGPFLATRSIRVNGVCDMCKHRIENALKTTPGISSANWNVNSHTLLVQYLRTKTNPDQIQQAIAAVGHDTEKFKAPADAYEKLPECCHYPRRS